MISKEKERKLKQVFSECDIYVRTRKSREKQKQYKMRGGVVCIAKKGLAKTEQRNRK